MPIVAKSSSHRVLLLAISQNRAGKTITVDSVMEVFSTFKRVGRVMEAINALESKTLIAKVSGKQEWNVTQYGIQVAHEIARRGASGRQR